MNIATITKHSFVLEFADEEDARAFLVDPVPAQNAIRTALAPLGAARAVASSRKKRDPVIAPKARASGRGRKPRERKPCPKCGRMMTAQGLSKHTPTCQGKPSA